LIAYLLAAVLLVQGPQTVKNRHDSSRSGRTEVYQGKLLDVTLDKAAKKIGVTLSTDDKKCLQIIVRRESGGSIHASSRSSSSKGLFGLLSKTHERVGVRFSKDPVRQCEAGLRYVLNRYQTPQRALAFWNATLKKDSSLAPKDLRKQASVWIQRGYKGY
jgi:hypothetical protein